MKSRGTVGRLVSKRSRGKMATTIKNGGTKIFASRGKAVGAENQKRVIVNKSGGYQTPESKTVAKVKKRGKTATVLKQVRSLK